MCATTRIRQRQSTKKFRAYDISPDVAKMFRHFDIVRSKKSREARAQRAASQAETTVKSHRLGSQCNGCHGLVADQLVLACLEHHFAANAERAKEVRPVHHCSRAVHGRCKSKTSDASASGKNASHNSPRSWGHLLIAHGSPGIIDGLRGFARLGQIRSGIAGSDPAAGRGGFDVQLDVPLEDNEHGPIVGSVNLDVLNHRRTCSCGRHHSARNLVRAWA